MNAVCYSVNVDGVVILLGGCGDTSTQHYVIEVVRGHKNLVCTALTPTLTPLVPPYTTHILICFIPALAPALILHIPARVPGVSGVQAV